MNIIPKNISKKGFSLIQVSILVAVAGIILASTLPGGDLGSDAEKNKITRERMEKIEEATKNFMAANLRRPCPADGTLAITSASFGIEDNTPGRCSNSNFYTQATPLTKTGATTSASSALATTLSNTTGLSIGMLVTGANIAADTHILSVDSATQITLNKYATGASGTLTFTSVAAGVVPTKTLGLPDDYMFDGYGRRISYMVDVRATDRTTCRDMQVTKTSGAIQIMDSAAATTTTDNIMWSLISHGKNGHGAFTRAGSSIAGRFNSGATGDDEEMNAFIDTGGTFAATFNPKLVRHEPVSTVGSTYFDDLVWTQEAAKNTCCAGKMCNMGTRIDGGAGEYFGGLIHTGDINGDGIPDIIGHESNTTLKVIFGRATGWTPSGNFNVGTPNSSRFFTITNNSGHTNWGLYVVAGDLNGDGYDDIIIAYNNAGNTNSFIKVYYGRANPVDINTSAITDVITFPTATNTVPLLALGNFSSPSHKDILALVRTVAGTGGSTAYVIYGASSYSMIAEDDTTRAATNGFKINTTTPGRLLAITDIGAGDVNNDGYDEVIIGSNTTGSIYVLFGQSPADWDADKSVSAVGPTTPDTINIDTRVAAGTTQAIKLTNGSNAAGYEIGRYAIYVADVGGPTPTPYPIYTASGDFSDTQGVNQWSYLDSVGGAISYDVGSSTWIGSEPYILIWGSGAHPGSAVDTIRRWTAPGSGTIRITGNAYDVDTAGGDGVLVSIKKNSTVLWQNTIANGDTTGFSYDLTTTVVTGNTIDFVVNKIANNNNDSTAFNPTIVYNDPVYNDIIFNNGNYYHVYYGKDAASWTSPNLTTAANYDGTNGFRMDIVTTNPAWATDNTSRGLRVNDVNNDGKNDIITSDWYADPISVSNAGVSLIMLQPSTGWSSVWTTGTIRLFSQMFDATGVGLPLNNDVKYGFRIDGPAVNHYADLSAIADIDNDGKNDLLISTEPNSGGAGSIHILFGRGSVPWDPLTNLGVLNY